jgi:hypothetical protein
VNGRAERLNAREKVVRIALDILSTERRIAEDDGAVAALTVLGTDLELAARDLTVCVDDAPLGEHPRGWQITPDVKP